MDIDAAEQGPTLPQVRGWFARRFSRLRNGYPQSGWAERYGVSTGAVQDLEQGRVLPSRAMVVLMQAIEMDPRFMQDVVKAAADQLAMLDEVRKPRN